ASRVDSEAAIIESKVDKTQASSRLRKVVRVVRRKKRAVNDASESDGAGETAPGSAPAVTSAGDTKDLNNSNSNSNSASRHYYNAPLSEIEAVRAAHEAAVAVAASTSRPWTPMPPRKPQCKTKPKLKTKRHSLPNASGGNSSLLTSGLARRSSASMAKVESTHKKRDSTSNSNDSDNKSKTSENSDSSDSSSSASSDSSSSASSSSSSSSSSTTSSSSSALAANGRKGRRANGKATLHSSLPAATGAASSSSASLLAALKKPKLQTRSSGSVGKQYKDPSTNAYS
ncbi:hypothetical protein AWZ03_015145, partial [Drosophila navojoa]